MPADESWAKRYGKNNDNKKAIRPIGFKGIFLIESESSYSMGYLEFLASVGGYRKNDLIPQRKIVNLCPNHPVLEPMAKCNRAY